MIHQPGKDDIPALTVSGGDGSAMVADRRGNAVVEESFAKVFSGC